MKKVFIYLLSFSHLILNSKVGKECTIDKDCDDNNLSCVSSLQNPGKKVCMLKYPTPVKKRHCKKNSDCPDGQLCITGIKDKYCI